jgi:hypothetical protein
MGDTDMDGAAIGVDDPISLGSRLGMWQDRNAGVSGGWG